MRFDLDVGQVKPGFIRNVDDLLDDPQIPDPVVAIRVYALEVAERRAGIGQDWRAIDQLCQLHERHCDARG